MIRFKQIFTALLLSLFLVPNAYSQPAENDNQPQIQPKQGQDYAMLIRKMNHLKAALKTVHMMDEDDNAVNRFEVVICGKVVKQLNDSKNIIGKATQAGITLTACGMSLNKFSIEENELPKDIKVVPNGLIRIFELQEQGYKTITL